MRRALTLPLGGDAGDEAIQRAGVGSVAYRPRGEVTVVALRPAERHVDVDVAHWAGKGGGRGRLRRLSPPPTAAHQ